MSFTRRTILLLVAGAFSATFFSWQTAALIMAVILVVAAVDAWNVRAVPVVDRKVSELLSRAVPSSLRIRALGRWPRIRLRQPATADLAIKPQESDRSLDAEITGLRRGSHVLAPVATKTVGPLGLGVWYHRTGDPATITIYPDMPAARRIATSVRQGHFREEGRRTRGPLGLGTEFESVREYRPDDDIRQLNWSATARLGTPMSNQFRVEQDRDVICLIDCGRLMAARIEDRTRLDAAVDAVAAIAAVADQVGDRVGVVAFSRRVRRTLNPRRDGGRTVVRAIHDLEPDDEDSDFELAFRAVLGRKRAFVLIITDLIDEAAARPLASAVPILARKHAVAVASVTDPDIADAITTRAETKPDLMRSAASVQLLDAKERVAGLLTHRGAEVIEAPLVSFSARCVAAYLRAKSKARL